jgi:hypothetical protein
MFVYKSSLVPRRFYFKCAKRAGVLGKDAENDKIAVLDEIKRPVHGAAHLGIDFMPK